ncbi:hypothetical protein H8D79_01350 [PVC group bacterium]|nr:hypothetical protein [PVC group bacterium]
MAVDERTQVRGRGVRAVAHVRAFLEIPQPQVVRVLSGPAFSHGLLANAQLESSRAGLLEMPVVRRPAQPHPMALQEDAIDRLVGASRLLPLGLDRGRDHLGRHDPRPTAILAGLASQPVEAALAIELELTLERGVRRLLAPAVGEHALVLRQLPEEAVDIPGVHLPEDHGVQQVAPKESPLLILFRHDSPPS